MFFIKKKLPISLFSLIKGIFYILNVKFSATIKYSTKSLRQLNFSETTE